MKLNLQPTLRIIALFIGLWCAFPAAAQELSELDDSCEDILLLEDCSATEKCCEQVAPIRAILLSIVRCTADPEPTQDSCEGLPHAPLPKSVLSYILLFEAAKNLHHGPQNFLQASHDEHHPIPSTQLSFNADDRGLGEGLPELPAPFFTKITLPKSAFEARLLSGVSHLPETPG